MKDNNALYQQKAEAKLNEIGAKIDELKARSEQVNADVKIEMNKRIQQLEQQRQSAREKLQRISKAGESAFEDLKAGAELALTDLKTAIDSAWDRFRD